MENRNNYDLNSALARCRQSAQDGYEAASAQLGKIERTLSSAREETERSAALLSGKAVYLSDLNRLLSRQIKDICKAFGELSEQPRDRLKKLRGSLNSFDITLFGRTMAGKSTLMEVLTHGDGKAIGNGAQRKTRDIRSYEWNGLRITDVPGIGAFNGQKDEDVAFDAAKNADMILFLMTDDGVQSQEAECFRSILELGKPVLCIMNVKASVDISEDVRYITEDIDEAFQIPRLEEIRRQFIAFGSLAGQDWNAVPFVYTHLRSAFLAQQTKDPQKAGILTAASRINNLKNAIAQRVSTRGELYRVKTFIDAVAAPIGSTVDLLLEQSCLNELQSDMISDKKKSLHKWIERFEKSAYDRVASDVNNLKSQLYSDASDFAARNIGSREINSKWDKYLKELKLNERGKELMEELSQQADDEIRELTRSMKKELEFAVTYSADMTLKSRRILDTRKLFEWGMVATGGLLVIAALVFPAAAPVLLLASVGVGLVKEFFGGYLPDKAKLERGAREKIENQLRENINVICQKYRDSLEKSLREILDKLNLLEADLDSVCEVVSELSSTQGTLAQQLSGSLRELHRSLLCKALSLIGRPELSMRIHDAAMIPGFECAVVLAPHTVFPERERQELCNLLGESIRFLPYAEDKTELVRMILGNGSCTLKKRGDKISAVLKNGDDPVVINKAKLAQQLSGIVITR
ncbi:GTPase domain-containing protein [Lachnoclostridium sp. MSJ-17]|uniref:GTPase domain-containing protein n=1 Tax=Lachnoclostridium sp. MSJ-17 TaxID=2841516 RepID=UPI001C117682|nr:GTPase domain-containing protein [Lachnoclostridium sp. MSJ-17]MBU5463045.1 GTPase domain-containing protein [Lachnoclostridium sp. MSJ-17]